MKWVIIVVEKSASDWDTDTITNLNKNVSIRFSTSLAGEAPLKRSVPVAPSASATFGPRLPARSLLRGRLRNCLIHCVVIVISDRNCVGKHSNAFLVISELSRLFLFFRKSNTFFIYFRMYFQKWKIPKHSAVLIEVTRLKFPDWSFQIEVYRLKFTDWSLIVISELRLHWFMIAQFAWQQCGNIFEISGNTKVRAFTDQRSDAPPTPSKSSSPPLPINFGRFCPTLIDLYFWRR